MEVPKEEQYIQKLIKFFDETNIPYEKHIREIRIRGRVLYTDLTLKQIKIETSNGNYVEIWQMIKKMEVTINNDLGEITKRIKGEYFISFRRGYLEIMY